MSSTWGFQTWGSNSWNSDVVTVSLTGLPITSSLGSAEASNEAGWGSDAWGEDGWNGAFKVSLTGISFTSSVGELGAFAEQGWGRDAWGEEPWGQSNDPVVNVTGFGITSSLGTADGFNVDGWGRQAWNNSGWGVKYAVEPTGQSVTSSVGSVSAFDTTTVEVTMPQQIDSLQGGAEVDLVTPVTLTGFGITSGIGDVNAENLAGWGRQAWGNSGWGVQYSVEPGGVSATFSIGSVEAGDIQTVIPTGQSITSSVGDISPEDVVGVSSVGVITSALGEITSVGTLTAITIDGAYEQVAEAVGALDIDCSTGNYFTKTINANSTFTFSNPAASGTVTSFTLELTHTSGTVTWPASVKWNADTAPTLTAGKTHLFMFVTDDGGTRYRGSALVDYVN